ncbi:hypothetical protein [Sphingobium sp. WCS2017Hpa-17]|uniref:hypothetical protein n=1 Tax=Sphingobium sp. WCS2017Hpa-17 TaxID=3073638 RepID=UPI00288A180B|nr:hypothetical protein [Sphingobium sp. WCS2017Hpa-17]
MSFALAIHEATIAIGIANAIRVTGRSKRMLQLWRDSSKRASPSLDHAFALDRAYVEAGGEGLPPILASYLRQMSTIMASPAACRAALMKDMGEAVRETAEAFAACLPLIEAGASPTAIHHAIAEAEQSERAITRWLARLKSFLPGNGAGQALTGVRL